MFQDTIIFIGIFIAITILLLLTFLARWLKKPQSGQAFVRTGAGGIKVSFTPIVVVPVLHQLDIIDITLKNLVAEQSGKEALLSQDGLKLDVKAQFSILVNPTDVKQVAHTFGAEKTFDQKFLEETFLPKFNQGLRMIAKQMPSSQIQDDTEDYLHKVVEWIERAEALHGYSLESMTILYVREQESNS